VQECFHMLLEMLRARPDIDFGQTLHDPLHKGLRRRILICMDRPLAGWLRCEKTGSGVLTVDDGSAPRLINESARIAIS
jgi:hypothetical protein